MNFLPSGLRGELNAEERISCIHASRASFVGVHLADLVMNNQCIEQKLSSPNNSIPELTSFALIGIAIKRIFQIWNINMIACTIISSSRRR